MTNIVLIPIIFATLCYLLHHSISTKSVLFYTRLIIAVLILFFSYTLVFKYLTTLAKDHDRQYKIFWRLYMSYFTALSVWWRSTATCLYCWQFYDTIVSVLFPAQQGWFFWIRQVFTSALFVSLYGSYCYYCWITTCSTYYSLFDRNYQLWQHYLQMTGPWQ